MGFWPVWLAKQPRKIVSFGSFIYFLITSAIKPKYTKTEDITVTKTDPSLLIFGGGNFQMKWAKK